VVVLDASVGTKWFKAEVGQASALDLLEHGRQGIITLAAPAHFVHEVLSVVRRHYTPADVLPAWHLIEQAGVSIIPLDAAVVAEAATQCAELGCSFYDALAPACAVLVGATLASADARAHSAFPGVLLIEQ